MVGFPNFFSTFNVVRALFGVLAFSVSIAAHSAGTCQAQKNFPSKDMRKDFGPIRDQGSIGWCYAYGAADQAGYWLKKNRGIDTTSPGNAISASAAALEYNGLERSTTLGQSDAVRRVQAATTQLTQEASNKLTRQRELLSSKLSAFASRDKRARDLIDAVADRQAKLNHKMMEQAKLNPNPYGGGMGGGMGPIAGSGYMIKPSAVDMFDPANSYDFDMQLEKDKSDFKELVLKDPSIDTEYKKLLYHQSELSTLISIYPQALQEKEGGNPRAVLGAIMGNGYCTEAEVPSEGFDYKPKIAPMGAYGAYNGYSPYAGAAQSEGVKAILNEGISKYNANPTPETLCEATDAAKSIFPKLKSNEISNILETSRKNENDAIDQLLKNACSKKKIDLPRPEVKSEWFAGDDSDAESLKEMQKLLKNGTPVGISYHPEIFNETPESYKTAEKGVGHYSVLVGQQYNCDLGEPEYILRNSWGKSSCTTNSFNYLQKNGNPPPYKCDENGYYIIPESQLKMGLKGISYYE